MRHNNIRDFEATLLKEVCRDVQIEPMLLPIGNSETRSSNQAERARLDVSTVGIWSSMERTFLDVRIMQSDVMNFIRTRIRFALLKSTLIAVRGVRGKSRRGNSSIGDTSLNLVPGRETYEV